MPREDTQFKKGEVANPNGRPKGSGLNLTKLLKEKLDEVPEGKKERYKDLFIKTLLHKALIEKDLQSLKLIMNYVDGLPKQSLDLTSLGESLQPVLVKFIDEQSKNNTNTK